MSWEYVFYYLSRERKMNKARLSQNMIPVMVLSLAMGVAAFWCSQILAEEPAAQPEAATQPEAAPETKATTTAPTRGTHRYSWLDRDRRVEAMKSRMAARREAMERYRSARRWWTNPGAESRRQWSQARSNWYRDMAEQRRDYYESIRPDYEYGYGYGRGGPWGDYEYEYGYPWGGSPWY
jgi:hypothetical protein